MSGFDAKRAKLTGDKEQGKISPVSLRETGAIAIIVNDSPLLLTGLKVAVAPQFRRVPSERTTQAASGHVAR